MARYSSQNSITQVRFKKLLFGFGRCQPTFMTYCCWMQILSPLANLTT